MGLIREKPKAYSAKNNDEYDGQNERPGRALFGKRSGVFLNRAGQGGCGVIHGSSHPVRSGGNGGLRVGYSSRVPFYDLIAISVFGMALCDDASLACVTRREAQ